MATISRSHRPTACRTTSRWPLVTGSKEPGYSAMRDINPSTPPRKTRKQAGSGGRPCQPFIFQPVIEPLAGRRVSYAGRRIVSSRTGDETKLRRGRNHFPCPRRQAETDAGYQSINETTGPPRPMTGDRHDQGTFRNRHCCVHRSRAHRSSRLRPAGGSQRARCRWPRPTGSISARGPDCSQQAWPNFEASCLRVAGSKMLVREARLVTAERTLNPFATPACPPDLQAHRAAGIVRRLRIPCSHLRIVVAICGAASQTATSRPLGRRDFHGGPSDRDSRRSSTRSHRPSA